MRCSPQSDSCDGIVPSFQRTTSTALRPRASTTNTEDPFGRGSSDQARYASEPPRILIKTSPGPSAPRVATINRPTRPTTASSSATQDPFVLSGDHAIRLPLCDGYRSGMAVTPETRAGTG